MQRGVSNITPEEAKMLLSNIKQAELPAALYHRLNNLKEEGVFLNEEEVELLLDAINLESFAQIPQLKTVAEKLRQYLQTLRV